MSVRDRPAIGVAGMDGDASAHIEQSHPLESLDEHHIWARVVWQEASDEDFGIMVRRTLCVVVALASLGGCSMRSAVSSNPTVVSPYVVQTGKQNGWRIFQMPSPGIGPQIIGGNDDAMWGTSVNGVVRIAMDGSLRTFAHPGIIYPITPNPDGNIYVAEAYNGGYAIAKLTPSDGSFVDMPLPAGFVPTWITTGSDGNLWIAGGTDHVLRMTTSGVTTSVAGFSVITSLTRGPDKNIWASDADLREIWRININDFTITPYSWPPVGATEGADGALWGGYHRDGTGQRSSLIYRIDMQGNISSFSPGQKAGVTAGPDKTLYWFGDETRMWYFNEITHAITSSRRLFTGCNGDVAPGPDGQMWLNCSYTVYVDIIHPIVTHPGSVSVGVGASQSLTVSEPNSFQKVFSAVSHNPAVATVTVANGHTFSVTGVSTGTTTITVSDKVGNSLDVAVTVN